MNDPKHKRDVDAPVPPPADEQPSRDDDRQITEASEGLPGYTDKP